MSCPVTRKDQLLPKLGKALNPIPELKSSDMEDEEKNHVMQQPSNQTEPEDDAKSTSFFIM
jgi:hypothetical protein